MITHSNNGVLAPCLVRQVLPPTNPQCTILGLPWVRKEIFMQLPEPPGSPISQADHFRSWWPGKGVGLRQHVAVLSQAATDCSEEGGCKTSQTFMGHKGSHQQLNLKTLTQ